MDFDFYSVPPAYDLMAEKLHQLQKQFPFLRLFHIGKSVLGRKIYAVGIGNLRHVNLFAGAFHAQEWLTCSLLIRFLEDLCRSIEENEKKQPMSLHETLLEKGLNLCCRHREPAACQPVCGRFSCTGVVDLFPFDPFFGRPVPIN